MSTKSSWYHLPEELVVGYHDGGYEPRGFYSLYDPECGMVLQTSTNVHTPYDKEIVEEVAKRYNLYHTLRLQALVCTVVAVACVVLTGFTLYMNWHE